MLVAEFMHQPPILISANDSIKDAIAKLLSRGENGAIVQEKNVLVGSITEAIILAQLYPSQQEFMNRNYLRDFEEMETNMKRVLSLRVRDIMNVNIEDALVYPTSSIIHVLSIMGNYGFSHLPVVNQHNEVVGEVSQRDIFKALIGSETPYTPSFDYHDWTARFYDLVHTASNRYENEVKSLIDMFKKHNVKTVLDIGYGTGTHAIALAQAGIKVIGIERSKMPYRMAQNKREKLAQGTQNRLQFVYTRDFIDFLKKSPGAYDAVMVMGNIMSHYTDWNEILHASIGSLASPGMLIVQNTNSNRILKKSYGLVSSLIAPSKLTSQREYSFTLFYDRPWKDPDHILLTMSVLRYDGMRWTKESINSTKCIDFKEHTLKPVFSGKKFKKVDVFGSSVGETLFDQAYDVDKHDWFTYVGHHIEGPARKS